MSDYKIIMMNTEKLKPYENNPRFNDKAVDAVAKSIENFGFKVPIVVDKNNVIVTGHTRLKAAQKLGLAQVPVIVADDLTPEKIKAFRLADNKVSELADWDFSKLEAELAGLEMDMTQFNFDMKELSKEFDKNKEVIEDDFDVDAELNNGEEPTVKRGEVWKLGNHYLMCGDSTNKNDVEKLINGEIVDLVFTDPPYGINIVGDNGKVGAENIAKTKVYSKVIADDTTETAQKAYEILKTFSDKLIIWGGNYFTDFLDFSDGWLIWDKRCGMNSTDFADGEMAYCSFHTPVRIYRQLWNGMIREGEHEERVHPTQKPVKMLSEILQDFSKENDTVLDVFCGSGSTLIACEQLKRKCYTMELDPKYCDVIIKRWETLTGKQAVKL